MTDAADPENAPAIALSIVVPAYASAPFFADSLDELSDYAANLGEKSEVIVVDDGSPDDTAAIADTYVGDWPSDSRLVVVRHPLNRGKGAAVRTGMLAAGGAHRLFTDADLAYGLEPVVRFREALDDGADVAAGCRSAHRGLSRRLASWVFRRVVASRRLVAAPDPQCGIKAFRAAAAERLFGMTIVDGFAFDVEVLHLASVLGMAVEFIPVAERDVERISSVRMLRDAPRMIRTLDEIAAASKNDRYSERQVRSELP